MERRTEGRTDGRTKDGRKDGRKDGKPKTMSPRFSLKRRGTINRGSYMVAHALSNLLT